MNAPAPAAAAIVPTAPQGRPAQATLGATKAANAATAAIARAEALATARHAAAPKVATPVVASSMVKPQMAAPAPAAIPTPEPAAAADASPWRSFFNDWPSQIPKRGILISRLNEASPFKAFMLRGDFLLLERVSPDSLGGRFLVIPFDEISTVKFTDPLKQPALEAAGFEGQLSQ